MPAKSVAQQQAMAIAEHEPSKLKGKNRGLLKMKKSDLHDFASTKHAGLPEKVGPKKRSSKRVSK